MYLRWAIASKCSNFGDGSDDSGLKLALLRLWAPGHVSGAQEGWMPGTCLSAAYRLFLFLPGLATDLEGKGGFLSISTLVLAQFYSMHSPAARPGHPIPSSTSLKVIPGGMRLKLLHPSPLTHGNLHACGQET